MVTGAAVWIGYMFHAISLVRCIIETMDSLKMNKYMTKVFRGKARVLKFYQKLGVRSHVVRGGAPIKPRPPNNFTHCL